MQVPNLLRQGRVGFNMTPMIDVVFLLIIFFLVSSHLAKQEAQLELPLPVAESGDAPLPYEVPRAIVNVLQNGTVLLSGHRVPQPLLSRRLRERLATEGKQLELKIRGDQGAVYRDVQPVLAAAAQAGIWNITVSVYRPEDVR